MKGGDRRGISESTSALHTMSQVPIEGLIQVIEGLIVRGIDVCVLIMLRRIKKCGWLRRSRQLFKSLEDR